ncbi:MAG: hypothetical protein JWR00_476 [Rubritepida sp.]|nr:hypothetical protein [Rubritepida sp.]
MVKVVFEYNQSNDIRWYAGEPTEIGPVGDEASRQAANLAVAAGEKVTREDNKYISWMKTSTSDGVCYALCAYWLAMKSGGQDFWTWLGPGQRAAPGSGRQNPIAGEVVAKIRDMMRTQKQGLQKTGAIGKFLEMEEFLTANSKLRNCNKILCNDMPISGSGNFFYISLNGTKRKGGKDFHHAVAASVGDGGAMLFDPNYGDIQTGGVGELNAFITYLCSNSAYYNIAIDELNYMALA